MLGDLSLFSAMEMFFKALFSPAPSRLHTADESGLFILLRAILFPFTTFFAHILIVFAFLLLSHVEFQRYPEWMTFDFP